MATSAYHSGSLPDIAKGQFLPTHMDWQTRWHNFYFLSARMLFVVFHLITLSLLLSHSQSLTARIVGGKPADPSQFEFFAGTEHCGASLVHEDVLLTAAHCRGKFLGAPITIGGSFSDGSDATEILEGIYEISHPQYSSTTLESDFMLVKLNTPSIVSPTTWNTAPMLPTADSGLLTSIGYGRTMWTGELSEVLLQVSVPYVDHETCNAPNAYNGDILEDVMFCAGTSGKDSCQGDSGGPILNDENVIMGVISWGEGCGNAGFPGVYARTSGADDFIRGGLCMLSSNPPDYCKDVMPANSKCANATSVTVGSTVQGTTQYASIDSSIPDCHGIPTAGGVWYTVTGTGEELTASLCGPQKTFDSKITVFEGSCGDLLCVDGDDDGCGRSSGPSALSWTAEESTTYFILVHGYKKEMGDFELTLSSKMASDTVEPAVAKPTASPSLRPTSSPTTVPSPPPHTKSEGEPQKQEKPVVAALGWLQSILQNFF